MIDKDQWSSCLMAGVLNIAHAKDNDEVLWDTKIIKMACEKLIVEIERGEVDG